MGRTIRIINEKRKKAIIDAKERYDNFVADHFNKQQIVDYFRIGLEAKVFVDQYGKVLEDNDHLMFGFFDNAGYQYTLRRRPRNKLQRRNPLI